MALDLAVVLITGCEDFWRSSANGLGFLYLPAILVVFELRIAGAVAESGEQVLTEVAVADIVIGKCQRFCRLSFQCWISDFGAVGKNRGAIATGDGRDHARGQVKLRVPGNGGAPGAEQIRFGNLVARGGVAATFERAAVELVELDVGLRARDLIRNQVHQRQEIRQDQRDEEPEHMILSVLLCAD